MHNNLAEPSTPSKSQIPIVPRRPKWDFTDLKQRFFFGGNGLKSAFVVALSSAFPPGEKEFIQSVRLFAHQVRDPKLVADVRDFAAQEGQHSLQHQLLNEAFDRLGYLATSASAQFRRDRARVGRTALRRRPPGRHSGHGAHHRRDGALRAHSTRRARPATRLCSGAASLACDRRDRAQVRGLRRVPGVRRRSKSASPPSPSALDLVSARNSGLSTHAPE